MGKALEKTKKTMEKIREKRAAELADIDLVIDGLREKLEEASTHEKLATASCNVAEYKSAIAEQEDIKLQIGMYEKRKKALKTGQLVTESDYKTFVKEVREDLQKVSRDYAAELTGHYEAITRISEELHSLINESDETLKVLQRDFFKNADRGGINPRTKDYEKPAISATRYAEMRMANEAARIGEQLINSYAHQYEENTFDAKEAPPALMYMLG